MAIQRQILSPAETPVSNIIAAPNVPNTYSGLGEGIQQLGAAIHKIDQEIKTKRANVEQSVITARMRALWTEVERGRLEGHLHTLEELSEIQSQSDEFINNGTYLSKEQRQQLKLHGGDLFNREYLSNQSAYIRRNQEIQKQDILSPLNNMLTLEGKIEYIEEFTPTMLELGVDVEKLRKDTIVDMYYNIANKNPSEFLQKIETDKAAARGDRAYGGLAGEISVNTIEAMVQKANSKIQDFQEARGQDVIYGEVIDAMVGFVPQTVEEFEKYEAIHRELSPTDVRRALEFSLRLEGMPIVPADIEKMIDGFNKRKEGFRLENIGLPLTTNEKLEVLRGVAPDVAAINNLSLSEYQETLDSAVNSGAITVEYSVQLETMFRQSKQAKLNSGVKLYDDAHKDRSNVFWEVAVAHNKATPDGMGSFKLFGDDAPPPYALEQVSDFLFERAYNRLAEEGESLPEFTIRIYTDGVKNIYGSNIIGKQAFKRIINEELEVMTASNDQFASPTAVYESLAKDPRVIGRGITSATAGNTKEVQSGNADVINTGTKVRPQTGTDAQRNKENEILRKFLRQAGNND